MGAGLASPHDKLLKTAPFAPGDGYRAACRASFDALHRACEPGFCTAAQEHLRAQRDHVAAALQRHGAKVKGDIANIKARDLPAYFAARPDAFADINITPDGAAWLKSLTPAYMGAMRAAAEHRIEQFGGDAAFDAGHPRVRRWLAMKARAAEGIDAITRRGVDHALRNAYASGATLHETGVAVRAYFDEAMASRAKAIARAETTAALNAGDIESVRQMGLEGRLLKTWLVEPDGRDSHRKAAEDFAHGIALDEEFAVDGGRMDAPGGGARAEGSAESGACRCALAYRLASP